MDKRESKFRGIILSGKWVYGNLSILRNFKVELDEIFSEVDI